MGTPLFVGGSMRRLILVIAAVLGSSGLVVAGAFPASAAHTATCIVTSYTLTGSFNVLSGSATFDMRASGSCIGTSTGVNVSLGFRSIGPWSCVGGAANGSGLITANNGPNQLVTANLVNVGGEYVVELLNAGTQAVGQFTTLPIPCVQGQTQTTVGGTGTLTFNTP
jgi:hypothetical protein